VFKCWFIVQTQPGDVHVRKKLIRSITQPMKPFVRIVPIQPIMQDRKGCYSNFLSKNIQPAKEKLVDKFHHLDDNIMFEMLRSVK